MISTIENHYTSTATISRMVDIIDTEKQQLEVIFDGIPCHVQPFQDSFSEDIDGGYGKDFYMYTANRDIRQGDRATIDGDEYRVMSAKRFDFNGRVRHMELRVRVFKNV